MPSTTQPARKYNRLIAIKQSNIIIIVDENRAISAASEVLRGYPPHEGWKEQVNVWFMSSLYSI